METLKAFPKYYTHESEDMKRLQHKELVAYKQNDEWMQHKELSSIGFQQ